MSNRNFILFLIVLSTLTMGANLGTFEADQMEARNFITAREMVQDGHWWNTTMNGLPRLEKPPLPTWMTAVAYQLSDQPPLWWLRLPAMLMGLLLVLWTYLLGQELFRDEQKARWSAVIAATSLLIIQQARTGSWDIYFVSFAIGSFVYLYRGLKQEGTAYLQFLLGGVLLGCSVLSKGPVAIIMLLGFGGGLFALEGYKAFLKKWKEIVFSGIFIGIIGFGWPIYNLLYMAEAAQAVIDKESVTWTTKHVKPFYFYIIFPLYIGIWAIAAILSMIPPIAKRWVGKSYYALIIWIAITIVLLSLLPMKKERYLLPVMPAMALMVGAFLTALTNHEKETIAKRVFWGSFGIVGVGLVFAPVAVIVLHQQSPELIDLMLWIGSGFMTISGVLLLRSLWQQKFRTTIFTAAIAVAVACATTLPSLAEVTYKNTSFESPSTLLKHEELQNRALYGQTKVDMRVIYLLGEKLINLEDGLRKAASEDAAFIVTYPPTEMQRLYPQYQVSFIDSAGFHKKAHDVTLYAYILRKHDQ